MKLSLSLVTGLLATSAFVTADAQALPNAVATISQADALSEIWSLVSLYEQAHSVKREADVSVVLNPILTGAFSLLKASGLVNTFIKILLSDKSIQPILYDVLKDFLTSGLLTQAQILSLLSS
ncbi:hypothetical protein BABINDRAFT_163954 [Babjeviella inositovora NRRL Y-12698]|uniref:Uncharacterized protein n=1 Tax=Babjeviella inositovora NRRL Y-12698 TaxID=984486 RepID=A0A1E3QGW9_9ASCO|nr:uncharacterized protein BABINDRAFT_163954 [Babjeviella inositovora NRRL Y-12698]ODQ76953.1 hypothetical protein BABINDRAFT_163954 [Babjeviella inositovora NRRL Y-12698]